MSFCVLCSPLDYCRPGGEAVPRYPWRLTNFVRHDGQSLPNPNPPALVASKEAHEKSDDTGEQELTNIRPPQGLFFCVFRLVIFFLGDRVGAMLSESGIYEAVPKYNNVTRTGEF